MHRLARQLITVVCLALLAGLQIPPGISRHDNARAPTHDVYAAHTNPTEGGRQLELYAGFQPVGTPHSLPIIVLLSLAPSPAAWFITGPQRNR